MENSEFFFRNILKHHSIATARDVAERCVNVIPGVGASEGPLWREHRKFLHGVFRDFGVGRPVFEEKIQEEISFLLQVCFANSYGSLCIVFQHIQLSRPRRLQNWNHRPS